MRGDGGGRRGCGGRREGERVGEVSHVGEGKEN